METKTKPTVRRVTVRAFGGPEQLTLETVAEAPRVEPGHLLVVDLAIDGVGAATLESTLKGQARGGTAVFIGSASGPPPAIQPEQLTSQCLRLAAGSVFSYTADPAELQRRAEAVIEAIRAGWLRADEGNAYPLERAAEDD